MLYLEDICAWLVSLGRKVSSLQELPWLKPINCGLNTSDVVLLIKDSSQLLMGTQSLSCWSCAERLMLLLPNLPPELLELNYLDSLEPEIQVGTNYGHDAALWHQVGEIQWLLPPLVQPFSSKAPVRCPQVAFGRGILPISANSTSTLSVFEAVRGGIPDLKREWDRTSLQWNSLWIIIAKT